MKFFATLATVFGMASFASAHMEMKEPPPFRSKYNDFTTEVDYSMTSPLEAGGGNFPCKGYHSLIGTPQGQSVTTWAPGGEYSMTITGSTPHNGGSCQASLSYDQAKTWTVIHSYIGNCPVMGDSSYKFTLPADTPSGEAIFAWTWFNQVGNREMYMNCAVVTVGSATKTLAVRQEVSAFSSRPAMFVANVGNGCTTAESKDLEFPNPGPDVTRVSAEGKTIPPVGSCASGPAPAPPSGPPQESSYPVDPVPVPSQQPDPSSVKPVVPTQPSAPSATMLVPSSCTSTLLTSALPPVSNTAQPTPLNVKFGSQSGSPGGVFVTISSDSTTPSTLQTVTKTSDAPVPTPTGATRTGASPTGATPSAAPTGTPSTGGFTPGTLCTNEGAWNCVNGKKFQRCASGQWSALIDVYPGTTCQVGQSDELLIARGNVLVRK